MKRRRLGDVSAQVGPHPFRRMSRLLHRNKCRACYLPPDQHPVTGYTMSRPLGDRS